MKPKQTGTVANQAVIDKVFAGQVKFLYRQLRPGLYASMVVGVLLVMALWVQAPRQHLLIWLGILVTVAVSRLFLLSTFSRKAPESNVMHHWLQYFILGAAAMGCVWGAGAFILLPVESPGYMVLMLFALGGIMVAASQSLSATITPFVVFLIPIAFLTSGKLFMQGEPIHLWMGLLMLFFSIVLLFFSRNFNKVLLSSLNAQFNNTDLVHTLEQEVAQRKRSETIVIELNRSLEQLARKEPLQSIFDNINRMIETQLPGSMSSILLLDPSGKHLISTSSPTLPEAYSKTIDGEAIGPNAGSCGTAAYRNEMVIVDDIANNPLWAEYRDLAQEYELAACWSAPIRNALGNVLGTFALYFRKPCGPDSIKIELIQSMANFAGIAIEYKESESILQRLAHEDALTALPNRALLMDRLEQSIAQAKRQQGQFAVLFVDLDHFKSINDTLGHEAGDIVLVEVANRLKLCVREMDTVARLGGDEFMLILTDIRDTRDVVVVAEKVLKRLSQAFDINGGEYFIGGSIGISFYPNDGTDVDTLIKNSDAAMYRAKDEGREGYQFYTINLGIKVKERITAEKNLRMAIKAEEFILHYQPIINLKSGHISGMEALVRWQHPKRGVLQAAQFIQLAEETGLILPIGELALRQACFQHQALQDEGLAPFPVYVNLTVNISSLQLKKKNLPAVIESILGETGLNPCQLELELTENATRAPTEESIAMLRDLKALGIKISIDDFGTGVSSINSLKHFPIDTIKIDRSLIITLPEGKGDSRIVSAMIDVAHSLDIKVIAEGVETTAQLECLRAYGFDEAQGYLFSRPLPFESTVPLLKKYCNRSWFDF